MPAGDRSTYFVVTAGEHYLRVEAVINGETVSASRRADVPEGQVCTWTVTDPPSSAVAARKGLREIIRAAPGR